MSCIAILAQKCERFVGVHFVLPFRAAMFDPPRHGFLPRRERGDYSQVKNQIRQICYHLCRSLDELGQAEIQYCTNYNPDVAIAAYRAIQTKRTELSLALYLFDYMWNANNRHVRIGERWIDCNHGELYQLVTEQISCYMTEARVPYTDTHLRKYRAMAAGHHVDYAPIGPV